MKANTILISIVLIVSLFCVSCSFDSLNALDSSDDTHVRNNSSSSTGISGVYTGYISSWLSDSEAKETKTPGSTEVPLSYNSGDFELSIDDFTEVDIDLSNCEESYLDGAITLVVKNKKIVITNTTANKYNIVLSGESEKGVTVKSASSDIAITLSSLSITSLSTSGEQALNISMDYKSRCLLILEEESVLTGCTEEEANAIKCDGSLIIEGEGSLEVYAKTKNGIVSDNTVVINSGTINIDLDSSTSAGTGIKSAYGYVQNAGSVTITGLNYTEGSENKGIKVEGINEDEGEIEYGKGKGYVLINGGELTIKTTGKGITASFDPDEDGDTENSTYDPSADIFINNGLITITTLATPREDSSSSSNDGVSPEGIEGKNSVTINGGKIILNTTDDAINTSLKGSKITINGGLIYAHSTLNDAVDTNGTITITGGTLISFGAGTPEGGIDSDSDSNFIYTGGTVIALGGSNNLPGGSGSSGYYFTSSSFSMGGPGQNMRKMGGGSSISGGDTICLLDSKENVIIAFTIPENADTTSLFIASSLFENGKSYYISSDSSIESSDYLFASSLAFGNVECTIDSSTCYTVTNRQTSISI